jgi:hypothetical protein
MKRTWMLVTTALAMTAALATADASAAPGRFDEIERGGERTLSRPAPPGEGYPVVGKEIGVRYRVTASRPRLNRRPMGPIRRWVGGVPAEPIDSYCWSGEGSVPISGTMTIDVDPSRNVGRITAAWTDENGDWTWTQTRFLHPAHHPSGVRIGASVRSIDTVINEPIVQNVYLHGDTAAGLPAAPTVFAYLAAWGPGDATLDGARFDNEFGVPSPQWLGHAMVTEGARREDGSVRTLTGEIYDPSRSSEGAVETDDIEAHLVFHDDMFPLTSNIPPLFSFFYHLVFEDVAIEIVQADGPPDE